MPGAWHAPSQRLRPFVPSLDVNPATLRTDGDSASMKPQSEPLPDDAELRRRIRAGEPGAQRLLFDAHAPRVWRLLFRLTGDYDDAHDLTQEALLHALRKFDRFDGRGSLAGWLAQLAVNLMRDELRTRRRRARTTPDSAADERVHDDADPIVDARVREAVERLSEEERVVVLMHDLEGYTHEEISTAIGIAAGSSRARLSRARSRLREWLEDLRIEGRT